jgi:hypothetical protein
MSGSARALPAKGYQPRSAHNALKEIVEDALEALLARREERNLKDHGPLHPRVRDLMEAFVRCGDAHFGFLRLKCLEPTCSSKTERIVPFSCKSRGLCPSCSQKRALLWAERMVDEVLPKVPCVQLLFTIPKIFRKAFRFKRSLFGELSRAAYCATKDFLLEHFRSIARAVPAMVVSPQSFGSLANWHPHCHAICALGVFDPQGAFHPAPQDLDFSPLERLFGERVFKLLLKHEATTEERVALVRSWAHSGFNVDSSRRLGAEDRRELQSLLESMERAPVSLERLEYRSDGLVHYRGKYHPGLGRDHQLLPAVDFLALLVPHVLLRYEVSIRSCGALSTTIRKRLGWIEDEPSSPPDVAVVESAGEFLKVRRRSWARLIARTWHEDPPGTKIPASARAAARR